MAECGLGSPITFPCGAAEQTGMARFQEHGLWRVVLLAELGGDLLEVGPSRSVLHESDAPFD